MKPPVLVCVPCSQGDKKAMFEGQLPAMEHMVQVHHTTVQEASKMWHLLCQKQYDFANTVRASLKAVESEALTPVGSPCAWCHEPMNRPFYAPFCSTHCMQDARGWLDA